MKLPCACGGTIDVARRFTTRDMQAHQAAEPHRSWRLTQFGTGRVTVGPLTPEAQARLLEDHARRLLS